MTHINKEDIRQMVLEIIEEDNQRKGREALEDLKLECQWMSDGMPDPSNYGFHNPSRANAEYIKKLAGPYDPKRNARIKSWDADQQEPLKNAYSTPDWDSLNRIRDEAAADRKALEPPKKRLFGNLFGRN